MWEAICSDKWVLEVIRLGYKLNFHHPPPLTRTPLWFSVSPVKSHFLQQAIDDMLHRGAIAVVRRPSSPGFYSRIFLVPKKNGKMRPVFDLSALNVFLCVLKFRMLTTRQLTLILSKGDWVASLDF